MESFNTGVSKTDMGKLQITKAALCFAGFILTPLVCASAAVGTADVFPLDLVKNGVTQHTIVLANGASLSESHAAQELQKFILEISGAELPIVYEGTAPSSNLVVIGKGTIQNSLAPNIDFDKLGDEGFALRRVGNNLVIAGGRLRGTMYGVYYLLDEVLGCRWYTPYVSKIPKNKTISIDQLDIVSQPDFEYRESFYTDAMDADWAARNRENGNSARLDAVRGGKIAYNHWCHTFDELVPGGKYYKDHPEYYSLIDGKRRVGGNGLYQGQLCLTNPEVLKIVTETVLKWIAANPEKKIVSVSQNDNLNYCKCPNCAAIDAEEGSPSGLMLRFVNAVAERVAQSYPDILIDTLAYQYTERPPKITKPRANVRIRLCVASCQHHPYETCPRNADLTANLKGWDAITDNMYIWHYTTNFANYLLPMPDLDQLPLSLRLYKHSGVKGVFCQGTYTANGPAGGGGWMDNLKAYLQAKMLWNTALDPAVVRKDFLQGFFGKAWQPMGRYIDLIQDKVRIDNIHGGVGEPVEKITFMPPDIIARCNALFDEAEKLADNPDVLARVKHARLSVRYVEVTRQAEAAASSGTPEQKQAAIVALQAFADDCVKDGMASVREGGTLQAWRALKLAKLREGPHAALIINSPDIANTAAGPPSVIQIDGVLNDSAWGKITALTFVAKNGEAAKYRTLAYTARDNDYLYFAFVNYEPEISRLTALATERDQSYPPAIWDDDSVEIFISPNPDDRAKCYQFIVNAKGTVWDCVHNSDGSVDEKWNSGFEVKTKIETDRWTVEIKIPFKDIGITTPAAGKKIAANLYRNRYCGQPVIYSCWSPTYEVAHFTPDRFGQITFKSE